MFEEVPDEARPIVQAVYRTVKKVKGAEEIACAHARPKSKSMMWKLVRFAVDGEVRVTIGTFARHASIFFAHGSSLDDPEGLLEGKGKELRYVTLRTPADGKRPALEELVRSALKTSATAGRGRARVNAK